MSTNNIKKLLLDYVNQHIGRIRRQIYEMYRITGTATLVLEYDEVTNTVSSHILEGDNCYHYPSERYQYYYVFTMTDLFKSQFKTFVNNRQSEYRALGPHMKEYINSIRERILDYDKY